MFEKILLCTDGSSGAQVAADYAIALAQRFRATLSALHIIDVRLMEGPLLSDLAGAFGAQPYSALLPKLQQIQRAKAEAVLRAVVEHCRGQQVDCTPISATGGLVRVLLDQEQNFDLVVLGQRGEYAEWAWETLGSSVERMVRASVKPCLVCPAKYQPLTHVLLAYDGSDESTKALRIAFLITEALQAKLTIATAYEAAEQKDQAGKVLEQARQQALNRKQAAQFELIHGVADQAILELTQQAKADLVVMGAYGHTRIRELILGSTTSQVLHHSTVPVLLARS